VSTTPATKWPPVSLTPDKSTADVNTSGGQPFLKFTVTPEVNVPHLSMTPAAICRPFNNAGGKFVACVNDTSAVNCDTNIGLQAS
jgi:hypothetical protein